MEENVTSRSWFYVHAGHILFITTLLMSWITAQAFRDIFQKAFSDEPSWKVEVRKLEDPDRPVVDDMEMRAYEIKKKYGLVDTDSTKPPGPTPEQITAFNKRYERPSDFSHFVNLFIPFLGKRDPYSGLWEMTWLCAFALWIVLAPVCAHRVMQQSLVRRRLEKENLSPSFESGKALTPEDLVKVGLVAVVATLIARIVLAALARLYNRAAAA